MWFYIYVQRSADRYELIGQTIYQKDAEVILDEYESGYIRHGKNILVSKNPYSQRSPQWRNK